MKDKPETCDINEEDLNRALVQIGGYVDVTGEDLLRVFALAMENARIRVSRKVPVSSVMTRNVVTVGPDADLQDISRLIGENGVRVLPVIDNEDHVIGIISEADVLSMSGMKRGHTFKDILRHILGEPVTGTRQGNRVEEFMSTPVTTVNSGEDILVAARLLDERRLRTLPVVDDGNRLTGIISRADLVRFMAKK